MSNYNNTANGNNNQQRNQIPINEVVNLALVVGKAGFTKKNPNKVSLSCYMNPRSDGNYPSKGLSIKVIAGDQCVTDNRVYDSDYILVSGRVSITANTSSPDAPPRITIFATKIIHSEMNNRSGRGRNANGYQQNGGYQNQYAPQQGHQGGYQQNGNYAPQGGYQQNGNYAPQGGYQQNGNYAPQGGYQQNGNYAPQQGGYRQNNNYAPQGGYQQNGNYAPQQGGYQQNGNYAPQGGYPSQSQNSEQGGYPSQGNYGGGYNNG